MVTLTYRELDAINDALFDTLIKTQQTSRSSCARALEKVLSMVSEARNIRPKPQFTLIREGEEE